MYRRDIHAAILYMEGTNCDEELYHGLKMFGVNVTTIPIKQLSKVNIMDFQILMIPGGFSAGDYIRAGAIFAARLKYILGNSMKEYLSSGRFLGGICNGFQVLTEMGLLPGLITDSSSNATLYTNDSNRFECRSTLLAVESSNSPLTKYLGSKKIYRIPSAHAEGKLIVKNERIIKDLIANDMIMFRYVNEEGMQDGYPWNPNGSVYSIAGITNIEHNVFGLMPHPERSLLVYNHRDWDVNRKEGMHGDGWYLINSLIKTIETKF